MGFETDGFCSFRSLAFTLPHFRSSPFTLPQLQCFSLAQVGGDFPIFANCRARNASKKYSKMTLAGNRFFGVFSALLPFLEPPRGNSFGPTERVQGQKKNSKGKSTQIDSGGSVRLENGLCLPVGFFSPSVPSSSSFEHV